MSLPKLEVPMYELNLPSTNKKIKYRPFLVKEYKVLLTASDTSPEEITRVVTELVDVCTFKELNLNKLPHFDLEYLFLQIRAKSIGETADLIKTCTNCQETFQFKFNIPDIKLDKKVPKNNTIDLGNSLGVLVRYPRFDEIMNIASDMNVENMFNLIIDCIDAVFDKDDMYKSDSFSKEEITEFVMNLTKSQFDKLENFLTTMPKIIYEANFNCPHCDTENKIVLEGLQNFFV